ncbi:hypothetical protein [uncultured Methanolobus sp.]|uniref:hypothetical protein n=1 Tax=uncultured Methanolobus sp. TaxID=218300 RepID=UPI0029C6CABC|nr:hypothetical protein [uncultured Methanolobus sp.]
MEHQDSGQHVDEHSMHEHEEHKEEKHDMHHEMSGKEHDGHMEHGQHEGHQGHSGHHAMMVKDFRKRFWISLVLTNPVLLLSPIIQDFLASVFGIFIPSFTGDTYLPVKLLL